MITTIKEDAIGSDTVIRRFPDISYRQLHYWTTKGWIKPRDVKTGSGIPTLYTREMVTRMQYMSLLINKLGFNPASASELIDNIFRDGRLDGDFMFYTHDDFIIAVPAPTEQNGR